MNNITEAELDKVIALLDTIRSKAKTDDWLNDEWGLFIRKMRLLNPQAYGPRIQNYLFDKLGWERVPAHLDKGDVRNSLGQYFETKVSLITPKNQAVNIVQVRPWQQISGHHIFVVDTTNQYRLFHFSLSKNEMRAEIELIGNSAHGTAKAVRDNINKEYRLSIPWITTHPIYQRWIKQYLQTNTNNALIKRKE